MEQTYSVPALPSVIEFKITDGLLVVSIHSRMQLERNIIPGSNFKIGHFVSSRWQKHKCCTKTLVEKFQLVWMCKTTSSRMVVKFALPINSMFRFGFRLRYAQLSALCSFLQNSVRKVANKNSIIYYNPGFSALSCDF